MESIDIATAIEAVFAQAGIVPRHRADLDAHLDSIRHLRGLGYTFRRELLYNAQAGTRGATRIGIFDTTGPVPSLIEERCYTCEGQRQDALLHVLVDGNGKAPLGW